ncbi:hypothetical protein ACFFHJ_16400 [Planotetraspora thailandica]|nr:hypothetical protein [Planotetraspora thailandica]
MKIMRCRERQWRAHRDERGEPAVRYRTAVVIPQSRYEVILVSSLALAAGCAAGIDRL